jgi:hypothetical protein
VIPPSSITTIMGDSFLFGNQVVEDQVRPTLRRPRTPVLTHAVLEIENGITRLVF